ncbi:McrB family protein [Niveibacterium sp. COAC-50]|uniref:McrB family protein n=1 Tax=Niveibacterium sp. COAC-50 TaxID=2729384 RepID=UPI001552AD82|nr:hypothetical protein [Niveibacterium sp. COAC-50]
MKLATKDDLLASSKLVEEKYGSEESYKKWLVELRAHLAMVGAVGHDEFVSPDFQRRLWNDQAISATGNGHVNIEPVLHDASFAEYLWTLKQTPLPAAPLERTAGLVKAWNECVLRLSTLTKRMPRLKLCRVFAALHPEEFSTIAHGTKLRTLGQWMQIPQANTLHVVELHRRVLDALTDALGAVGADPAARMTLPWMLYLAGLEEQGEDAIVEGSATGAHEKLKPLPAARRRRGMLGISGYFDTLPQLLQFAAEGCSREDLKVHIHSVNAKLNPNSIATTINSLIAEWGALVAEGNQIRLTPRGAALLETQDPAEASDWLLTRILGFDHILFALRQTPATQKELVALLQKANPGWKSNFAPGVMVQWAKSMALIKLDHGKKWRLTDDGSEWAARIHWTPECLQPPTDVLTRSEVEEEEEDEEDEEETLCSPNAAEIIAAMPSATPFSPTLVTRLHAGLWLHPRRHFAVLTGLSGAGKTALARAYGKALRLDAGDALAGLCTIPVQPGWHDPSSLLGYVNPLAQEVYVRTPFLEFLLEASGDPGRPYTVVLDEMNLSHPEQYFAPLLSAMETGDDIVLHAEEGEVSGVPPRVPYPENLVIIGTVNMDETTHGLSDKVLDRCSVIEFWDIDIAKYPDWAKSELAPATVETIRSTLVALSKALRPVRLHFGWRTVGDVLGYVRAASSAGSVTDAEALDQAIYGKVLPKLRGEDSPRLREAFKTAIEVLQDAGLAESKAKLTELAEDLKHTGSARFWR